MIPDGDGKPESRQTEADQLARLLEIELEQKKAEWAEKSARYRNLRTMAFLFLAVIIMGAIAAFFYAFTRMTHNGGATRQNAPSATHP